MQNIIVCPLFLFLYLICSGYGIEDQRREEIESYFWREYAGFIPHDALPGGTENGKTTYIGQVLFKNLLVPAKIVESEKKAYFEWGYQEHVTDENIKILCTDKPKLFRWISSSKSDFKKSAPQHLIIGGFEPDAKLFIGRAKKNGEILLGKLLVNEAAILHSTLNGKSVESEEFEILTFDTSGANPAIDSTAYYWRDYAGVIPRDALPGGVEDEQVTYIAQVLFNNLLVPGKIVQSDKRAEFEWGLQAHTATEDVKIFCTDKKDRFHWFSTNSRDFRKIKDKHFVVASHEGNGILYIGRATVRGDKIVGKLLVNENVVLHTAENGRAFQTREFEVLYYDPPVEPETVRK